MAHKRQVQCALNSDDVHCSEPTENATRNIVENSFVAIPTNKIVPTLQWHSINK